jgi:hypothetical protein
MESSRDRRLWGLIFHQEGVSTTGKLRNAALTDTQSSAHHNMINSRATSAR